MYKKSSADKNTLAVMSKKSSERYIYLYYIYIFYSPLSCKIMLSNRCTLFLTLTAPRNKLKEVLQRKVQRNKNIRKDMFQNHKKHKGKI